MTQANSVSSASVLLIGGPDAGKSNFLFRLWIAIDAGKGVLVKDGLPDEVEHLRAGAEMLLCGNFAARTSKEVLEHVCIPVKSVVNPSRIGTLTVPDVPGEKVMAVYRNRQWSAVWEDRIADPCGGLMFVRAGSDEIAAPLDYTTCVAVFGSALQHPTSGIDMGTRADPQVIASSDLVAAGTGDQAAVNEPPTQVVLTDWLQFLRRAFTDRAGASYRPRVGLVVAAWDAVPEDQQERSPAEYLSENFPLLYQFIETNGDCFDFQVFGLSIVSGDLKNDEDFKAMYEKGTPNDFGYVIHSLMGTKERSPDVTIPVAWALRLLPEDSA